MIVQQPENGNSVLSFISICDLYERSANTEGSATTKMKNNITNPTNSKIHKGLVC